MIIIGSDSPQISSKYILKAVDNLVNGIDDVVIGPCNDGGFVLFGSKVNIAKSVWTDVEYSKNSTLCQLTEKLDREKATYSYIPKISDVDNYNDLKTIYNVLKLNFMDNLKAQNELALWIDSIIHFDRV